MKRADLDAIANEVAGRRLRKGPPSPWEAYREEISHLAKKQERGEIMLTRVYDALKLYAERSGKQFPSTSRESLSSFIRREREAGRM